MIIQFVIIIAFVVVLWGGWRWWNARSRSKEQGANKEDSIILYNRQEQCLLEEVVPQIEFMRWAYETRLGFIVADNILKYKFLSKLYGNLQDKKMSKYKILSFVKKFNIDEKEMKKSVSEYKSFNDFFTRELKAGARLINNSPEILISPCDGKLLSYHVKTDTIVQVKGRFFTIEQLVRDNSIAKKFEYGICLVFRLAPTDYHRYCYIDDGEQEQIKSINGYLHSVNPIALGSVAKVFWENERQLCVLHTKNFGEVLHIDIGAMLVGKIVQHNSKFHEFKRGEEKGYFKFGGSTIVLVFRKESIIVDEDILEYSKKGIESIVKYGSAIGKVSHNNIKKG